MKPTIKKLGDAAVLVEFEQRIDVEVNRRTLSLRDQLVAQENLSLEFLTPAFCSLVIGFDPGETTFEQLSACVSELSESLETESISNSKLVRIPVCYDPEFGLDLAYVAERLALSIDQVIGIHQRPIYHAYMLGFLPGFAYLGCVEAALQIDRKANPRTEVPSGSVGLAGMQTGIYPAAAPGGWQIIGRTPLKMFSAGRENSFLITPGDQVEFFSIDRNQFDAMVRQEIQSCHE
jgi:inhibitor of KinA